MVYCPTSDRPQNQFYFWPGYRDRHGENALYVGKAGDRAADDPPLPPELVAEFRSVVRLGIFDIQAGGRTVRRVQIAECRDLK